MGDTQVGAASAKKQTSPQETYSIITHQAKKLPLAYKNMIFSKFLRSLKFGNDYFKLIDNDFYFKIYHQYIEVLMNRPETYIKLAVLSDDHDIVLGWSMIENKTLHYVHVQKDNRNQGIGISLIPFDIEFISHITKVWMPIWTRKFSKVKFNPF